ncbi:MAG: TetR/AcrR family transcriptional regulator [Candidatus Heimdallarchaeota archaeon]|nr:TetR/AcrR family transcriptional regulator [Candidatus Heimdallarchaeota archaeon]
MSTVTKEDTRKKILNTALNFIRSKSYNSFSFNDIAKEVGIKKASVHYHFESKEILGIAAVENYKEKVIYLTKKLDKSTQDPWERLEHYFAFFKTGLKNDYICPAAVLSAEINSIPKEMENELRILFDYYMEWLSKILELGRDSGEFKFSKKPIEMALFISSAIEGAMLFARAYKKPNHYDTTTETIIDMLGN